MPKKQLQFPDNLEYDIINIGWYVFTFELQFPDNLEYDIILTKIPICYDGDFSLKK